MKKKSFFALCLICFFSYIILFLFINTHKKYGALIPILPVHSYIGVEMPPLDYLELNSTQKAKTIPVKESSDITFYADGFYYQPIPDNIKEYIYGKSYKEDCSIPYDSLRYLHVRYYDFSHREQNGEIICNQKIAQDLVEIFFDLFQEEYEIESIKLVDYYGADDEASMEANNTSCFNYRTIAGKTTLSNHSLGLAIDINPLYNPYVTTTESGLLSVAPHGSEIYADRSLDFSHKITTDDLCYQLFSEHGFQWGGNWKHSKDYQHFEKNVQ